MDDEHLKSKNGTIYKENLLMEIFGDSNIKNAKEEDLNNKDKNIKGFQIPFIVKNNDDYEVLLKEKLKDFIKEIDRPAFQKEDNLVDDIKKICEKVIQAFEAAKIGNYEEAEKIVSEILENYAKDPFAVSELDRSYAFRGIAPFEELRSTWGNNSDYDNMLIKELSFFRARVVGAGETIQRAEEINYLPYTKREKAGDKRFSSKNKVCLYLGTTSYVCSIESQWDKKDNLYLSSFKFNERGKRLKILNLVVLQSLMNGMIPGDKNDLRYRKLHNSMIRVFPLVIATMFTIETSDDDRKKIYHETIKYEYLLSQVLMNVLKKEGIDGVAYLSRRGNDDFQYPQMVNLAIPVTDISEEHEYGDLINCYVMTKPVLFKTGNNDIHFKKRSYINETAEIWGSDAAKVDYEGEHILYKKIPFSQMDDYLINQRHIGINEKNI